MEKQGFFFRGDMLWVRGTINGTTYKKSTGRKKSSQGFNIWYKSQNASNTLYKLINVNDKDSIKKMSLDSFGYKILNDTCSGRSADTQKDLIRLFEQHILIEFKGFNINEINSIQIANFLKKKKKEFSPDRAKRIKQVLNLILNSAVDPSLGGILTYNPMHSPMVENIKFGSKKINQQNYKTQEIKMILENATGFMKLFLEIAFKHGLRVGEIIALKWNDFDLENGELNLCRSITKGVITEVNEDNQDDYDKKNHFRKIALFPSVINLVRNYYQFRQSDEWLFLAKDGRPFMNSKSITDYHFKPLLKRIGVEYKTMRASRRAYATIFNYSNENNSELQSNLGHSKGSAITNKHYINEEVLGQLQLQKIMRTKEELFMSYLT